MTEHELRVLIGQSQEEGFRALFRQYQAYVYAIVWGRLCKVCTKEDAEECVSDVFASVFLHFDHIAEGALQGYIGVTAKRAAIDRFRKQASRKDTFSLSDENLPEPVSPEDVEAETEAAAVSETLLAEIRALGEPDATIIIQKYFYNRKSEEIAAAVNLQTINVRVRLSRALKRLRKRLEDKGITL
ncbi:MAG: sigma-70 family RNA polymerase sigma factor [Oscillospiraceae bacterium]|nr:sigma-70 family RNA polymerase sigma factor [Oscillospiraceae bacterium]MBQ5339667.1 sigma-70 family RNA polymerase sigma factor [Oscillospiraceae bacterium]MBQ9905982.1 sigma-70 family RNA polymerase sigma factor [Oscillospiraceae bacterium]MBR5361798.1 sigma-70 family RNA polymerase sigma factor [Oscillospiraceae bacterium]